MGKVGVFVGGVSLLGLTLLAALFLFLLFLFARSFSNSFFQKGSLLIGRSYRR
jgi:hypothetical protein